MDKILKFFVYKYLFFLYFIICNVSIDDEIDNLRLSGKNFNNYKNYL